jgi:hypothetical protein
MRFLLSALILGVLSLPITRPGDPPTIFPASSAPGGGVLFDSPMPVPWDSLVPASLRQPALEADSSRRLALFAQHDEFGGTEVTFPLPLPALLAGRRYYLIDSTGAYETRPTDLQGTVRIRWVGAGATVESVGAFGKVHAAARFPGSQGFVVVTGEPMRLQTEPSHFSSDALLAPGGGTYPHRGTSFWQVLQQQLVRETAPTPHQWVWVQWAPDSAMLEAGCSERFALFDLTPAPVLAASLDDGCDV